MHGCLPSGNYPWKTIVLLGLDIFLSYFAIYTLPAYAPEFISDIGVPWTEVGYVVGTMNNLILAARGSRYTCIRCDHDKNKS